LAAGGSLGRFACRIRILGRLLFGLLGGFAPHRPLLGKPFARRHRLVLLRSRIRERRQEGESQRRGDGGSKWSMENAGHVFTSERLLWAGVATAAGAAT